MNEPVLFLASAVVGVVVNLLGLMRGSGAKPARILVVKLDHVGDVVLATPAIRALRESNPDAVIDALVLPSSAFVLAGNAAVNRILVYDSPRYRRGLGGGGTPAVGATPASGKSGATPAGGATPVGAAPAGAARTTVLREVVRDRYDIVVELRGDEATLSLPFRCDARRRVDRGTVRIRDWIARRLGGGDRPPLHEVETNLEIVRPLLTRELAEGVRGVTPEQVSLEREASPEADRSLTRKLERAGVSLREPIVTVHAGASWRPRAWDPARFAAVADWIRDHYHAQVVFIGSEDERDIEATIRANLKGGPAFWLTGAITWDELHALLTRSALFLGNDSGPAHLAASAGTPSVVLFGPQDPRRFGPWSSRAIVLHHPVPCWPCAQKRCVRPEHPCVNDITVAEVTAAIARLLDVGARATDFAPRQIPDEDAR